MSLREVAVSEEDQVCFLPGKLPSRTGMGRPSEASSMSEGYLQIPQEEDAALWQDPPQFPVIIISCNPIDWQSIGVQFQECGIVPEIPAVDDPLHPRHERAQVSRQMEPGAVGVRKDQKALHQRIPGKPC